MSTPEERASAKRRLFQAWLDAGFALPDGRVRLEFVPTRPGVVLPEVLTSRPAVCLDYSHRFDVDLEIDDTGVACCLSFDREPFRTVVPWSAVYAMMSIGAERTCVWREDFPDHLRPPPPVVEPFDDTDGIDPRWQAAGPAQVC